jgi:hypothetical protein
VFGVISNFCGKGILLNTAVNDYAAGFSLPIINSSLTCTSVM